MFAAVLSAVIIYGLCTSSWAAQQEKIGPSAAPLVLGDYNVKPVPFNEVRVSDGFWTPRQIGRASCRERVYRLV